MSVSGATARAAPGPGDAPPLESCTSGNSCYQRGLDAIGRASKADDARAAILFQRACALGVSRGCEASRALGAGASHSAALLRRVCGGGEPRGCTALGAMYLHGWGVTTDEARAVSLLQEGCSGGDAEGCGVLGASYSEGRGVGRDVARAVAW